MNNLLSCKPWTSGTLKTIALFSTLECGSVEVVWWSVEGTDWISFQSKRSVALTMLAIQIIPTLTPKTLTRKFIKKTTTVTDWPTLPLIECTDGLFSTPSSRASWRSADSQPIRLQNWSFVQTMWTSEMSLSLIFEHR